jgi:hypothetical protein
MSYLEGSYFHLDVWRHALIGGSAMTAKLGLAFDYISQPFLSPVSQSPANEPTTFQDRLYNTKQLEHQHLL